MARPSILEAVERKRRTETTSPAPARASKAHNAEPAETVEASPKASIHAGKINVSAYFPPEVKASLRLVQAKRGGKVQDLLGEALNLLFAKYNVPETAPVETRTE